MCRRRRRRRCDPHYGHARYEMRSLMSKLGLILRDPVKFEPPGLGMLLAETFRLVVRLCNFLGEYLYLTSASIV